MRPNSSTRPACALLILSEGAVPASKKVKAGVPPATLVVSPTSSRWRIVGRPSPHLRTAPSPKGMISSRWESDHQFPLQICTREFSSNCRPPTSISSPVRQLNRRGWQSWSSAYFCSMMLSPAIDSDGLSCLKGRPTSSARKAITPGDSGCGDATRSSVSPPVGRGRCNRCSVTSTYWRLVAGAVSGMTGSATASLTSSAAIRPPGLDTSKA